MNPSSVSAANSLLQKLGAPPRLLQHLALVGEAGELLLSKVHDFGVTVNADFVRIGIAIHDAGKILHPGELNAPGSEHEPAGQELLLKNDVSPELARVCVSHARWASMDVTLEELLVALADKLWKGVRYEKLEQRVIDAVAIALGSDRWELFVPLDTAFEEIAAGGAERLERSRT
jgi:hypothetical protein